MLVEAPGLLKEVYTWPSKVALGRKNLLYIPSDVHFAKFAKVFLTRILCYTLTSSVTLNNSDTSQ